MEALLEYDYKLDGRKNILLLLHVVSKCGTSLSGYVKIRQEKPGLTFSFDNADQVLDENADYMVECSGEFPTVKQGDAVDLEGLVITPFIRYINCMETDDSYEQ